MPGTPFEFLAFHVEGIRERIRILLYHEHGKMMREKVGVIRLCVEGQERRTFEMPLGGLDLVG